MAGPDRREDIIQTLVELVSWTSTVAGELVHLRPVGGDTQSVRQQQDIIQVDLFSDLFSR